ncbi:MAG: dihydroorotase [Actinomycetes bacterium]|jgi:dihydroorotase
MSNSDFLLNNVLMSDGASVEIEVREHRIARISSALDSDLTAIDGRGAMVLPGLVDLHTHLREPGKENSETVLSGSQAAIKGGYTALSAMANTSPVADTAGVVEQVARLGKEAGLCDVFPIGAVTVGLKGESLAELSAMAQSAAQVRIFSDDGHCISDPLLMRRALEYVKAFGGVIAQHAQDPLLTVGSQMNEGIVSSRLGLKGWPSVAEESIIARDILMAHYVQSRLHICHLTTKGGVELVRWAKSQGIAVTAEVTPHHLMLTDDLAESYDPVYKVNPPLRTAVDVQALREGLADGTIDIVATDHAPHPAEDKDCEWSAAAFGMIGLETALSIVAKAMIETGLMDWTTLAQRMSTTPAAIGGYEDHGAITVGNFANFVVVDPSATWKVDRTNLLSRSSNTPFHDFTLPASVVHTFFRGVHVLKDSQLTGLKYE